MQMDNTRAASTVLHRPGKNVLSDCYSRSMTSGPILKNTWSIFSKLEIISGCTLFISKAQCLTGHIRVTRVSRPAGYLLFGVLMALMRRWRKWRVAKIGLQRGRTTYEIRFEFRGTAIISIRNYRSHVTTNVKSMRHALSCERSISGLGISTLLWKRKE